MRTCTRDCAGRVVSRERDLYTSFDLWLAFPPLIKFSQNASRPVKHTFASFPIYFWPNVDSHSPDRALLHTRYKACEKQTAAACVERGYIIGRLTSLRVLRIYLHFGARDYLRCRRTLHESGCILPSCILTSVV